MEFTNILISLLISVTMLKFQPKSNKDRAMFIGLVLIVTYLITRNSRTSLLITTISFLLHSILENNMDSIKGLISSKKEHFGESDTDDEDEEGEETETSDDGEETDGTETSSESD